MRKILSLFLSLTLLFALAVPVNAGTASSGNSVAEEGNVGPSSLGIQDENKIVAIDDSTMDVYLNNLVWVIITTIGTVAAILLIVAISGTNARIAAFIGVCASIIIWSIARAENGVIIRLRMVDISPRLGLAEYTYAIERIRDQQTLIGGHDHRVELLVRVFIPLTVLAIYFMYRYFKKRRTNKPDNDSPTVDGEQ